MVLAIESLWYIGMRLSVGEHNPILSCPSIALEEHDLIMIGWRRLDTAERKEEAHSDCT
jgi:hypothetical protein